MSFYVIERQCLLMNKLHEGSKKQVEELLSKVDGKILNAYFESVHVFLSALGNEDNTWYNVSMEDNFIHLLIGALDWKKITEFPRMLISVQCTIKFSSYCSPQIKKRFVDMGAIQAIVKILKKEEKKGKTIIAHCVKDKTITMGNVISNFFYELPSSKCNLEVSVVASKMIIYGLKFKLDNEEFRETILKILETIFPTMFRVCQKLNCLVIYQVVLVKMIYWANAFDVLTKFVKIEQIVAFVKKMFASKQYKFVVIGLSIVNSLMNKYLIFFHQINLHKEIDRVRHVFHSKPTDWLEEMYTALTDHDYNSLEFMIYQIKNGLSLATLHLQSSCIPWILEFIMPDMNKDIEWNIDLNYSRLRTFIKSVLDLPKDVESREGRLTTSNEGIEIFRSLVYSVKLAVDNAQSEKLYNDCICDMFEIDTFINKLESPTDVELGIFRSPCYTRVLSPSKRPDELRRDFLVQSLRLLSILNAVNENCGVLFGILTTEGLIERKIFISFEFYEQTCELTEGEISKNNKIPHPVLQNVSQYPFLLPDVSRKVMFRKILEYDDDVASQTMTFTVSRQNCLDYVSNNLCLFDDPSKNIWEFKFDGEAGTSEGPKKEFYTEFSRDCQRHDLKFWMGEPLEDCNGIVYVDSSCGLFPAPKFELSSKSENELIAMGKILVRSILYDNLVNFEFSPALYKYVLTYFPSKQNFDLIDLKDVMPSIFEFVSKLVDALKLKWSIEKDDSLTNEECKTAISKIAYDGSFLEKLDINFTVPCFPDIEMKSGGRDIFLNIENAEEYLKLLIWWILHKGPQKVLDEMSQAFWSSVNKNQNRMSILYPDEIDPLFCGLKMEKWTVDYLKKNCILHGFSIRSRIIKDLFEVLSELTEKEQKLFLKFVTSRTRLPHGGLENLEPKMSIVHKTADDNPNKYLPMSMTCSNTLFLYNYGCKTILREKLLLAITDGNNSFTLA